MSAETKDEIRKQATALTTDPEFREGYRETLDLLQRELRETGTIATTGEMIAPDDLVAAARFIGGLREQREQAGLSLADVAERSGIDKAALSRLETGWQPNPTLNTLVRYARAIGKRLVLGLED